MGRGRVGVGPGAALGCVWWVWGTPTWLNPALGCVSGGSNLGKEGARALSCWARGHDCAGGPRTPQGEQGSAASHP